jgi:hypothetical protein
LIPADAVKGALRASAEEIAAWLDVPQQYPKDAPAEPTRYLFAALFGGAGQHHYSPAKLLPRSSAAAFIIPATAIDPHTGTARTDTLRSIETIAPPARFECACQLWLETSIEQDAETLLAAALSATESIGAKAGIGFGRLRVEQLRRNGKPFDGSTVLSEQRIKALAAALEQKSPAVLTAPQEQQQHADNAVPQWWKLTITLYEPACIGRMPLVGNSIETHELITATSLRGALRAAWLREGRTEEQIRTRIDEHTLWTPALPAFQEDDEFVPCAPVPRSFVIKKDSPDPSEFRGPVHDRLCGDYTKTDAIRPQLRGLKATWMSVVDTQWRPLKVRRTRAMHVAREYRTRSKRAGALFSRDALAPESSGQRGFVAYAKVPGDVDWPKEFFIGKRSTVGGRASLHAQKKAHPWPSAWSGGQENDSILIELLSPVVMRGEDGYFVRSLDASAWARIAELPAEDIREIEAHSATESISGWMSTWNHGRARATSVAAGSVYKLICKDRQTARSWRARLQGLAIGGIGERNHEGFGWIAVDPPWLGVLKAGPDNPSEQEQNPSARGARPWPGTRESDLPALEEIADAISTIPKRDLPYSVCQPLQELFRIARNDTTSRALEFLQDRRTREQPGRWKPFKEESRLLQMLERAAAAREVFLFALEALLIRAKENREEAE